MKVIKIKSLSRIHLNVHASGWFYTDFILAKQFHLRLKLHKQNCNQTKKQASIEKIRELLSKHFVVHQRKGKASGHSQFSNYSQTKLQMDQTKS